MHISSSQNFTIRPHLEGSLCPNDLLDVPKMGPHLHFTQYFFLQYFLFFLIMARMGISIFVLRYAIESSLNFLHISAVERETLAKRKLAPVGNLLKFFSSSYDSQSDEGEVLVFFFWGGRRAGSRLSPRESSTGAFFQGAFQAVLFICACSTSGYAGRGTSPTMHPIIALCRSPSLTAPTIHSLPPSPPLLNLITSANHQHTPFIFLYQPHLYIKRTNSKNKNHIWMNMNIFRKFSYNLM